MSSGAVSQLLAQVNGNTQKFLQYFSSQQLPEPSYDKGDGLDPSKPLPKDVAAARDAAVEAADELHHLLLGPLGLLFRSGDEQYMLLSIQYIYRYNIAQAVPYDGETTFEEVANKCNVDVNDVKRFLRVAIARHIFEEPKIGSIAHTAASKLLLNNPMLEAWTLNIAQEFWPSLSRTVDATEKWPGSEEPNESGYSLSHNTNENPFDVIKTDPHRQRRFIDAMSYSHLHPSYNVSHLVHNYPFDSLTKPTGSATIVDVGGSEGQAATAIARAYPDPNLRFVVQDQPATVSSLATHIPDDLKSRIEGMPYDFFAPQPIKGAALYLYRWILHDWPDKYCVKILQALIPAMKKGAKVLINDVCVPQPGQLGIGADRALRLMDISMKAFNNARERDPEVWKSLFEKADGRFRLVDINIPKESNMAIILAEWTGE
ncbi:MAG: hypothetical protein Q9201_001603 [Fulgogasparrea decipioides]